MINSIKSEILRILVTKKLFFFLCAGFGSGLILTGGIILIGPEGMNPPMPLPSESQGIYGLLGILTLSAPIPVLLGSKFMTDEQEYRTVVPTILAQPLRHIVVLSKLAVSSIAGTTYALLHCLGVFVGLYGACYLLNITPAHSIVETAPIILRIGAAMVLYTMIGVGIGALIPKPQVCLAVIFCWFYFLESMISAIPIIQPLYPWLPGGAASAITGQSFVLEAIRQTARGPQLELLPSWAGIFLLLSYAGLAAIIALVTTLKKDIR